MSPLDEDDLALVNQTVRRNLHGGLPGTEGIVIGMDSVACGRRVCAGKGGSAPHCIETTNRYAGMMMA